MDGKKKITTKRYIIPTLVVVLIASLLIVFGNRGQEDIPEKHVIETTHNYLVNRAEQLQGNHALLKKHEINWAFSSAVMSATTEAVHSDDGLGKSVEIHLDSGDTWSEVAHEIPTWSNALEMLAQNRGNGLWVVSIGDWELEFNERTAEVKAGNNEAAKLLEEITLRTYHNTKYGYSVDYPPELNVLDVIQEAVSISYVSSDGTIERAIFVYFLPNVQGLGLNDYAEERVNSFPHEDYQIYLAEGNQKVGGIVAYITDFRFESLEILGNYIGYEARWYFIEKDENICEILTVARPMPSGIETYLFDPYTSFRFQP